MKKGNSRRKYLVLLLTLFSFLSLGSASIKAAGRGTYDCKDDLHRYEVKIVTPPEEDKEGLRRYVCQLCGDIYEEAISRYGHIWSEWVVEQEATCSTEGLSYRYCISCGRGGNEEKRILPLIEHEYGAWQVEREVTEETEGLWKRNCIYDCGEIETKVIPRLTDTKAGNLQEVFKTAEWPYKQTYRLDAVVVGGSAVILIIYGGLIISDLMILSWYRRVKREVKMRRQRGPMESGVV